MSSISKEFRHNPLMALVPKEGDFGDLTHVASKFQERLIEVENELSMNAPSDEKMQRELTQEKDMLEVVISWMGLR
jgi:hypothetical protein